MITWSDQRLRPYTAPKPRAPWRDTQWAPQTVQLDLPTLHHFAWPDRLIQIQRGEAPYLADLRSSVAADGPREPMLVIIDDHGRAGLQEGHHRLIVASDLGFTHWPTRFEARGGKLRYGTDLSKLIVFMLQGAKR